MGHEQTLTAEFAFLLGALHALEPGHGKTAMFAYLVGGRKSAWHAVVMAISTALSHSVSILVIAGLTHALNHLVTHGHSTTSELTRPLEWVSAGLIFAIGLYLFFRTFKGGKTHSCGPSCSHHRPPAKMAFSTELKFVPSDRQYKVAALLGFSGGLLPCPTAVAAYLSGVAGGNTGKAFLTIVIFSIGIALSLTVVGILLKHVGDRLAGLRRDESFGRYLGYFRSSLVLGVGCFYLIRLVK